MKNILLLLIILLPVSCASTGPKFSAVEPAARGKSVIYIYRPWALAQGAASPDLMLNGVGEYSLQNGGYLRFEVESGQHEISIIDKFDFITLAKWPKSSVKIEADVDKEYFVRYTTESDVVYGGQGASTFVFKMGFQLAPKEIALSELGKTSLSK